MEEKDPLARFLIARLKLNPLRAIPIAWALGLFFLLLPTAFGFLRTTAPGRLGSLDDWHTQLQVLVMAPAIWALYLWRYQALAKFQPRPLHASWRISLVLALGAVVFDLPEMVTTYGRWWATAHPLIIATREALLLVNAYMLAAIAQRHLQLSFAGQAVVNDPQTSSQLERYYLVGALLWGILGSRLSIEVIELPARAGSIPPDFYLKVSIYLLLALVLFVTPLPRPFAASVSRLLVILLLPAAFLLLFWVLGLQPQFAY